MSKPKPKPKQPVKRAVKKRRPARTTEVVSFTFTHETVDKLKDTLKYSTISTSAFVEDAVKAYISNTQDGFVLITPEGKTKPGPIKAMTFGTIESESDDK